MIIHHYLTRTLFSIFLFFYLSAISFSVFSEPSNAHTSYTIHELSPFNFGSIIPMKKNKGLIEIHSNGRYRLFNAVLSNDSQPPKPASYLLHGKAGSRFDIQFPDKITTPSGIIIKHFHIYPYNPIKIPSSGNITFYVGAHVIIPREVEAIDTSYPISFRIQQR